VEADPQRYADHHFHKLGMLLGTPHASNYSMFSGTGRRFMRPLRGH
jgi:hypothetical protein